MATKTRLMKCLQEIHGYAEITNRRPTPRPAVLYLMALRSRADKSASPQYKRSIPVQLKSDADVPQPVKITHRKQGEFTLPIVIG